MYKDLWLLDTASTDHITNNEAIFGFQQLIAAETVTSGTGETPILAKGEVNLSILTPDGPGSVYLKDILFSPGYSSNVISLSKIYNAGYDVDLRHNNIFNPITNEILVNFERIGSMWVIAFNEPCTFDQTKWFEKHPRKTV